MITVKRAIAALLVITGGTIGCTRGPSDDAPAESRPAPNLTISVNGGREVEVFQRWPLIVEAGLLHPGAFRRGAKDPPMLLSAEKGPWSNALQLVVTNDRGERQTWPFHLSVSSSGTLRLDIQDSGELTWWLAPEETARIPDGTYEIVAVLDTRKSPAPGGWRGRATSVPVSVRVRTEPSPLAAAQESEKYELLASYLLLRGDSGQAMAHVDELLKRQPGNLAGLELKGDLLALEGKIEEALESYDQALDAFYRRYSTIGEPPRVLLRKQTELLAKLSKKRP